MNKASQEQAQQTPPAGDAGAGEGPVKDAEFTEQKPEDNK